jgi:hypothetical protein
MGRKRAARWSIWACSEGLGWPVSAARSGGSGGSCRRARGEKQREGESKLEREREGTAGGEAFLSSRERSAVACISSGDQATGSRASEQLHSSTKKTRQFCKKPPRFWGFL